MVADIPGITSAFQEEENLLGKSVVFVYFPTSLIQGLFCLYLIDQL